MTIGKLKSMKIFKENDFNLLTILLKIILMILNLSIFLVIVIFLIGIVYSKSKAGPKRSYQVDLSSKIVIITGSSAGVGKETARKMASRGATVIFACRNKEKTLKIINEIQLSTKNSRLHFIELNLPDYNSVRNFAKEFQ